MIFLFRNLPKTTTKYRSKTPKPKFIRKRRKRKTRKAYSQPTSGPRTRSSSRSKSRTSLTTRTNVSKTTKFVDESFISICYYFLYFSTKNRRIKTVVKNKHVKKQKPRKRTQKQSKNSVKKFVMKCFFFAFNTQKSMIERLLQNVWRQ